MSNFSDSFSKIRASPSIGRRYIDLWSGWGVSAGQADQDRARFRKKATKDLPKGEGTRRRDQNLQDLDGNHWRPAVYHHNIRVFLMKEASRNGKYTYPRERAPSRHNVTTLIVKRTRAQCKTKNGPRFFIFPKTVNIIRILCIS